jgi:SAM-dependent methyltransferase
MAEAPIYDRIGRGYAQRRRPDPRIAARIIQALGNARAVVNVGAGTGSYEPDDREVVAVEPSEVMIGQRPENAALVVRGVAEALPFHDGAFDAALAVLTVHHWTDAARGLAELRRVARQQVVFTWGPSRLATFWLTRDYLWQPEAFDQASASLGQTAATLAPARIETVPIPHDCTDGFYAAYWRRPEAYLDPEVRDAISCFELIPADVVERALARLAADLESGEWHRRNAGLLELEELDLGYRLVIGDDR